MNIQMVRCDMDIGKAVKRDKGKIGWWSCYFIPCGQGEGLSNKMTLVQRLKYMKVYQVLWKELPSRGKSKGIEMGM